MKKFDLANLSISQKIGQVVMPRLDFRNSDPVPQAKELIERFHVGGFIVFGGERPQVKKATEELQAISEIPLFFACDAERGVGQIVSGMTRFPFAMSLGAVGDEELVYRQSSFIAEEMTDCGLNLVFAPVLDLNTNPDNPIINIRSYGDDPALVSQLGRAFIEGCQDRGILACAKHFPGHGGVEIDSHITLPTSTKSLDDFRGCDLIPFKEAIESGVASIMIAHLAVPQIDSSGIPATLSSEIINRLLIHDLGFRGLIITDSFHMGAISDLGEEDHTACLSILSGCTIILDPRHPVRLLERLNDMARGGISEKLLDDRVETIISAKRIWLNKVVKSKVTDKTQGDDLIGEIARRSVCLLKGDRPRSKKAALYVLDATQSEEDVSLPFLKRLTEAGIECERKVVPILGTDFLFDNESGNQATICLVYTGVAAWKGHTELPETFARFMRRLSSLSCEKVLVSFGSPYVVRGFEKFDTIISAFDKLDVCQHAAADILLGRIPAEGKLPVKL